MPRNLRRLGRVPGLVALSALLASSAAWAPARDWRSGESAGGGHYAAAVADVVVPAPAGDSFRRSAGATVAAAARDAAVASGDLGSRRVPALAARPPVPDPPAEKPKKQTAATKYSGRNHVWIPALHMSYDVHRFPCPRQKPPGNYMYRWECAGKNNVYLMGHAWGVMKPLHDAYAKGRLRIGMLAYYADPNGRVRTYKVTKWLVARTGKTFYWGIASQPVPSMTLQTCWGRNSEYRLKVRLVAIN